MPIQHSRWWYIMSSIRSPPHGFCQVHQRSSTSSTWHRMCLAIPSEPCHGKQLHRPGHRHFSKNFVPCARAGSHAKAGIVTPLYLSAEKHLGRTAVLDRFGRFTYDKILHLSLRLSRELLDLCGCPSNTLGHARIGFLCENDVSYVLALYATWMAGGVGVPLCKTHPVSELEYFVQDSGCSALVASQCFADRLRPIAQKFNLPLRVIDDNELVEDYEVNEWFVSEAATTSKMIGKAKKTRPKRWFDLHHFNNGFKNDPAVIIYTSGTTGRPKVIMNNNDTIEWVILGSHGVTEFAFISCKRSKLLSICHFTVNCQPQLKSLR